MFTFNSSVKESASDIAAYEGHIEPTFEGMQEIVYEASLGYSETSSALYIADVMVESSVKEGANMEVLVEGVVKDSFARIKAVFQKMWAKVKAWFANVKKLFKQLTLKGKDFIKQFKSELTEKARAIKGKGFKYKGYHLTVEAGQAEAARIAGILTGYISNNAKDVETAADQLASAQQSSQKLDVEEAIEKMWSDLKVDNAAELAELVRHAHHNGEEDKEVIEDLEANNINELIEIVEKSESKISDLDKMEKQVSSGFSRILKALQTAETKAKQLENKAEGDDASTSAAAVTALVTARLRVSKAAMAAYNTVAAANVAEVRAGIAQAQSTLRSLLAFKVKTVKESSYTEDFGSEDSILESAMRML